jgi:ABC-2 type transport system ATP-binding protein
MTQHAFMSQSQMNVTPLAVQGISKAFGASQVLQDISLSLVPGEIFGLIGLNGIGKTTLIKIMLDLLHADQGQVHFFEVPHTRPQSRSKLAYLPEKFAPSPFLKGQEFLSLSLSFYKRTYQHEQAMQLAEKLDLDPGALANTIGKYSKGMGQKLGLIAMLMADVPLLILDEPMSGLDPRARIRLKKLLKEYSAAGNTVFFSSHILADMDEICQRVAILHDGKIIFLGTPQEFRKNYNQQSLEESFLRAIGDPS